MLAVVFRRHLREGVRYDDYVDAWRAEKGYGVKARVLNATSLENEREVLTVGFVGISTHAMKLAQRFLKHHDESRHDRIEDVIDTPPIVVRSEVIGERRLGPGESGRAIRPGSGDSMLHLRHAADSQEPATETSWLLLARGQRLRERVDRRAIDAARTRPSPVDSAAALIDARGVDDHNQLVRILFAESATPAPEWSREWIDSGLPRVTGRDGWRGEYLVRDEHDFQKAPIKVPLGSDQSILGRLGASGPSQPRGALPPRPKS
jgi:hypothetical protein